MQTSWGQNQQQNNRQQQQPGEAFLDFNKIPELPSKYPRGLLA